MNQLAQVAIVGGVILASGPIVAALPGAKDPGIRVPTTNDTWYTPSLRKLSAELGTLPLGSFVAIAVAHRTKLLAKWGAHPDHPTLPNLRNNGDLGAICQTWLGALPWNAFQAGVREAGIGDGKDLENSDNSLWPTIEDVEKARDRHEQGYFRNIDATSQAVRETWSAINTLAVSLDTEGVLTTSHRHEENYTATDGIVDTAKAVPGRLVDGALGAIGGLAGALGPVLLGVGIVAGLLWWKS